MHVIVGGNGGQMAWAAYVIVFWLHRCWSRPPQDITVDITRALGVSHYGVVTKALVLVKHRQHLRDAGRGGDAAARAVITDPLFMDPASAVLLDHEDKAIGDAREVEAL